jgi:hypothetical protein
MTQYSDLLDLVSQAIAAMRTAQKVEAPRGPRQTRRYAAATLDLAGRVTVAQELAEVLDLTPNRAGIELAIRRPALRMLSPVEQYLQRSLSAKTATRHLQHQPAARARTAVDCLKGSSRPARWAVSHRGDLYSHHERNPIHLLSVLEGNLRGEARGIEVREVAVAPVTCGVGYLDAVPVATPQDVARAIELWDAESLEATDTLAELINATSTAAGFLQFEDADGPTERTTRVVGA